jgi:hypothetical protein
MATGIASAQVLDHCRTDIAHQALMRLAQLVSFAKAQAEPDDAARSVPDAMALPRDSVSATVPAARPCWYLPLTAR